MTAANRALAIAEELHRADGSLAAANHLVEGGFLTDAVSRMYYSLLYRVRALLLTLDLEAKSHEGALRLLSLHFIKSERLGPSASHLFSRLLKETATLAAKIADLIRGAGYPA